MARGAHVRFMGVSRVTGGNERHEEAAKPPSCRVLVAMDLRPLVSLSLNSVPLHCVKVKVREKTKKVWNGGNPSVGTVFRID